MARILVVDDAAFQRVRLRSMLEPAGHKVFEASTGRDGVAVYEREKPDAVLMDVTMPEMDGIAALRAIMAGDPGARIVMVTAMGQQGVVMDAIRAGARDFIVKPVTDANRLHEALKKVLS
ncbi:MAG: response regulator [Chloroflexota bacterium]